MGARTRIAGRAWGAGLASLAVALAGCGSSGSDHTFILPPGSTFDTVASDRVLLVVEAQNECGSHDTCTAPGPSSGACDVGNGNTRGLAIYRLGAGGLLLDHPARAGVPDDPEQVIATADNPRRLLVNPNDPSIVYVATLKRIQVFRLGAVETRCIGETKTDNELDPNVSDEDNDAVDLAIDSTVGNGVLYVAERGSSRIDAFAIAADGSLPSAPTSCIIGANFEQYSAVIPLTEGFLAAGGRSQLEIFPRVAGQFPPVTPEPPATPTPGPSPGLECVGVRTITQPISAISGAFVTDLLFEPSPETPIGQLFVAEESSRRLFTFPVDAAGELDDDDTSRTHRAGIYERLLRREVGTDSLIYVSVFQEGRVDVFRLENGLLPEDALSQTAEDPFTLPVGLAIDEPGGEVLYVAQGGAGRIDGFAILSDGSLGALPTTSTAPVLASDGRPLATFPDDVAIVPLP